MDRGRGRFMKGTGRSCPPVRPALPAVKNRGWCRNPIDFFILAKLEAERARAFARGGEGDAAQAAEPRPGRAFRPSIGEEDAFLADRRVRCLHEAGRAAARFAALRRALGPDLARRRALRRLRRLRERQVAPGVLLSRLGRRRLEPRPALRPVHHRADRRRLDPGRNARTR